jgi:hypothetical protein
MRKSGTWRVFRLAAVAVLGLSVLPAQGPTPPQAWAQLREHGNAVQDIYNTQDGSLTQIQELMRLNGAAFASDRQKLLDLRNNLALKHRDQVYTLWTAGSGGTMANALRLAQNDFNDIGRREVRFLELAHQMVSKRTPQSESEFKSYLNAFARTIRQLDSGQFEPIFNRIGAFVGDCPLHADLVSRFADPSRRAIDAWYSKTRPSNRSSQGPHDREWNEMKAKCERLIQTFQQWDAKQGQVLAAGSVVRNDWGRIHRDTSALADKLASPEFIKDLPDLDAQIVIDTMTRIKGYLQTYR